MNRKLWTDQLVKIDDITHCPDCTKPLFPPCEMRIENPIGLVLKHYTTIERYCLCGWKHTFIVKFDGLSTSNCE